MRPQRQVRRGSTRPAFTSRPSRTRKPKKRLKLPSAALSSASIKLAIISTLVLTALVVFAQATRLQSIKITGVTSLDADHLQRLAEEGANKQWLGRSAILLNTGNLEQFLVDAEPGIKEAEVSRQGLNSIKVNVSERQPKLNWKSGSIIYLLDIDGTVIGESKGPYTRLPTVSDSTNLPVEVGKRVAPSSFVNFCSEMYRRLPEVGIKPIEMIVPETTSEINIKTDKGYRVKMDTTRSVEGELASLKAVQAELTRQRRTPAEYIDLRIENKAYFK